MSEAVISVQGLHKSYGDFEAVKGIDLEVARGEIFAFLGPNGAGKTTTVEVLEGYRKRTDGEVAVLGEDPARPSREWRQRIGIVLQQCKMPPELTVRETLEQYAGYYSSPRPVDETIEHVGLEEKADTRISRLSGGQQRRVDVGVALIGDPELLFLDEPTTGFDPQARRQAWEVIANLRDLGKTIFLTTHYMDEAERLADRAAVIAQGQIVATGTPSSLRGDTGAATTITFKVPDEAELPSSLNGAVIADGAVTLSTDSPLRPLNELTGWALERGIELDGLEVKRPSLEEIYLTLTEGEE